MSAPELLLSCPFCGVRMAVRPLAVHLRDQHRDQFAGPHLGAMVAARAARPDPPAPPPTQDGTAYGDEGAPEFLLVVRLDFRRSPPQIVFDLGDCGRFPKDEPVCPVGGLVDALQTELLGYAPYPVYPTNPDSDVPPPREGLDVRVLRVVAHAVARRWAEGPHPERWRWRLRVEEAPAGLPAWCW